MIYSSLAVLALSASAVVNPLTNLIHLHPKAAQADTRVSIELYNKATSWREVRIGDHTYTVHAHQELIIKAPAGTIVYEDTPTATHRRGDVLLEVTPALNNTKVTVD